MKLFLISALCIVSAVVVAVPVDRDGVEDDEFEVSQLIEDLIQLHDSANDVIEQVETTLLTMQSMMPHSMKKRQWKVGGDVSRGPYGTTSTIDVSHKSGDTVYGGKVSRGPGGTTWGAGVSHKSDDLQVGASVQNSKAGTSVGVDFGKTWNKGNTKLGVSGSRGPRGGVWAGIKFSHDFGK